MWEIVKIVFFGGVLAAAAAAVVFRDRRPETDEQVTSRIAAYLSETLHLRAPLNPVGQIACCRQLLQERMEDGIDRVRYTRILVEALHRNWPHLPREYLSAAFT